MILPPVADQRIVAATAATLTWQGVDADGENVDPGTVTIGVVRSDGTEVVAAGTATTGSGTAARTRTLTVAQTANLDRLTATWKVGADTVATTVVDVVGGVYVPISEVRATEPALGNAATDQLTRLKVVRSIVETMFESATNRAFVPRFNTVRLDGTGTPTLVLPHPELRRVSWARVYSDATTYTSLTAGELAAIPADRAGLAVRTDANTWPTGVRNIEIGYEYGLDLPPPDIRQAAILAIRSQANTFRSGIPDRAISWQPAEGGNVVLATPGLGIWVTGIPAVDETLKRWTWHSVGIA